ncbi:MAG: nucleotidyl transferase AbiEii/AbiGii toxin family protein [Bryobacteraceae bacterium]
MIDLFEAAASVQSFCDAQGWRSCFIGGLAVQRWGEPRVTRDVDLSLLAGFGDNSAMVAKLLGAFYPRIADVQRLAREGRVVLLKTGNGIGIDVSLAGLPFEERMIDRASDFEFTPGSRFRTCSAEDLIVMKLFAARPIDYQDARGVVARQGSRLNWNIVESEIEPLAEIMERPALRAEVAKLRN